MKPGIEKDKFMYFYKSRVIPDFERLCEHKRSDDKYRFDQDHYLENGVKIIPKVTTVMYILEAYDKFGLELAVSEGSYDVEKGL